MKTIKTILTILLFFGIIPGKSQSIPNKVNPFIEIGKKYIIEGYRHPKIKNGIIEEVGKFVGSKSEIIPLGSGTVITKEGLILTNYHVGGNADPEYKRYEDEDLLVKVYPASDDMYIYELNNDFLLPPTMKYKATVVGADPSVDMMVLRIKETIEGRAIYYPSFDYVEFGNPYALTLNNSLTVVGYPGAAGSTPTITQGRFLGYYQQQENQGQGTNGLIKTDAAISPGNSGGAALCDNKLVGVPSNVTINDYGSVYGIIHPVDWAASSLIMAKAKFGENIPAIKNEWTNSPYCHGIAKNNTFITGKLYSQQTSSSIPGANILVYRSDVSLDNILKLYDEVQVIKLVLVIKQLINMGYTKKEIAKALDITAHNVEQANNLNIEKLKQSLSSEARSMLLDGEFYYELCSSDESGFFMTNIPKGKEVRMLIKKSGYRDYSNSYYPMYGLHNDFGRISLYQY